MRLRFRIATLIVVAAILAVDFAWMRLLHPSDGRSVFAFAAQGFDLGVLPMANVLAIVAYRMASRRGRPDPFLAGFVAGGLASIVGFMAWSWASPQTVTVLMLPLYLAWSRVGLISFTGPSVLVLGGVSFLLFQLLIATLAGWLSRRLAGRVDAESRGAVATRI